MNVKSLAGALALAGAGAALLARARKAQEDYSFADRVVLITGGSRGLGLVIGRMLAEEGAKVAIAARDEEELARAKTDIAAHGGEVLLITADVGDKAQAESAVRQVIDHWDRIDALINVAGVIQVGPWEHMSLDDFEQAMAVHLWGPLYTIMAAVPEMRRQGEGRIVNVSSVGGKIAVPHMLPYSASKFALVGLSDGLRAELAPENIHVTTVAPGLLRTGSTVNAQVKGQHQKEYNWFTLLDSLPFTSVSAEQAARQIIEATRCKAPELTISIQARLAVLASHISPGLFARSMQFVNLVLPDEAGAEGDKIKSGSESESAFSRSPLTTLTYEAAERNNELPA